MQKETDLQMELQSLVSRKREALIHAAMKILNDRHDAEDVVQDTLASVYRRIAEDTPRSLSGYVFRAVENNALKRLARRRTALSLHDVADPDWTPSDDGNGSLDIDPITLERALQQLPETQQAVIRMKYYLNMTFKEIGLALSVSLNTAASRCRYGLERLRKDLTGRERRKGKDK